MFGKKKPEDFQRVEQRLNDLETQLKALKKLELEWEDYLHKFTKIMARLNARARREEPEDTTQDSVPAPSRFDPIEAARMLRERRHGVLPSR